jgi:hypothetical protein
MELGVIPSRLPDGRYRVLLRFRLDLSAGEDDVTAVTHLLQLAPRGTSFRLGASPGGARLLELTSANEGDVFAFATRIVAAIRKIGDLVSEEPAAGARTERAHAGGDANWSFEPPGETDEGEPPKDPGAAARWAGAVRRALLGR